MNYTSAVFESETQSLEAAQLNKLRILSEFAKVTPDKKMLDIGCGWGACLEYLVTARGVKRAVGVTLSTAQAEEVNARKLPGVECVGADFMKWETQERFDGLVSICMIDHLCSPEEPARARPSTSTALLQEVLGAHHPRRPVRLPGPSAEPHPQVRPWGALPPTPARTWRTTSSAPRTSSPAA